MTPFLEELALKFAKTPGLEAYTFIFPNRRAALYFQYYLSQSLTKPQWAPHIVSIEEFLRAQSSLLEPDRLTIIHRLYQVYQQVLQLNEPFDRFYFWGDMLLRDFDEIDKYMVNASQLFKDLSKIKELDETFDYLTDEQKQFLKSFWLHFEEKPSDTKEQFLQLWRKLPKVYTELTKQLKKDGLGYEGMIHREVADRILKKGFPQPLDKHVFAGFNALTKAEAVLMTKAVEQGAQIFWDEDAYYTNDPVQEAGQFMRQYRQHAILKRTFDEPPPEHLLKAKKSIVATGVPQKVGQAKLAGDLVREVLATLPNENRAMALARTVVVLPDESMLLPVLHAMPAELSDINVTMGFPLRETPLYNLLDLAIEMQTRRRKDNFAHREVTALLGHPYVENLAGMEAEEKWNAIVAKNRVYVPQSELRGEAKIFELLFQSVEPAGATEYLLELTAYLGATFSERQRFDREYAFHFYQHLARLQQIFSGAAPSTEWRGFQKLFRQVVLSQKIPFSGEPLRGLQVMGVLETRNLDFDNVILLSLNEGMLPASAQQGTYLPTAIRKAYGLPTHEHHDAMYAYLFYRLLQRASNIHFFYNTEPDIVGNGEMSRFLQQLLIESGLPVQRKVLHNPVHVQQAEALTIPKTDSVLNLMQKYVVQPDGNAAGRLSPSSLNDYIECSLRFYLKNVVRLTEAEEVEEDMDARTFGNVLHDVIHWFYEDLCQTGDRVMTAERISSKEPEVDALIDRAFRKKFHLDESEPVSYEGQRVIVKEIARSFVQRILDIDKEYAPFEVLMLENAFAKAVSLPDGRKINVGGHIDRADRKDGRIRVIDYKTGGDDLNFDSVPALFGHAQKHNKAAFQTFLYAFVVHQQYPDEPVQPGLFNRRNLFEENFVFGHSIGRSKNVIGDARPYLAEFETHLHQLIAEVFDPALPFGQTTDTKKCQYCLYKSMCRR